MSKKTKSSKNFYSTIMDLLNKDIPPSHINENNLEENSICSMLNITKQNLNYYLRNLKSLGLIGKKGKIWIVTKDLSYSELKKELKNLSKKKSSRGMMGKDTPTTNLHALEIKFPIIKGKIPDTDWEVKNKLKNWLPKYKGLDNLGGLTIRNNNNKSLQVFAKARDIKDLNEVDNLAFKIRTFIHEYFKSKYGVILDVFECEVKNINLATEDKASEGMLRKGEKFELRFNKDAEKIFPRDKIKSKAWIDGSPFAFTAETNDKDWKREYLRMPFSVRNIQNSLYLLEEYNKNLMLHTKVQEEQLKTQKAIQKYLGMKERKDKKLKLGRQSTLSSFT